MSRQNGSRLTDHLLSADNDYLTCRENKPRDPPIHTHAHILLPPSPSLPLPPSFAHAGFEVKPRVSTVEGERVFACVFSLSPAVARGARASATLPSYSVAALQSRVRSLVFVCLHNRRTVIRVLKRRGGEEKC